MKSQSRWNTAIVPNRPAGCRVHGFVMRRCCNGAMSHVHPGLVLRTPLAAQALAGRAAFTLRQRSILLMAEGTPRPVLEALFHGQGTTLVQELLAAGYLTESPAVATGPFTPPAGLRLARLRAQLLELCERLLHEQEYEIAPQLRQLLLQAPDLPSLRLACERWMQTLVRQGGARRIHCLRTQLAVLLAPPPVVEGMDGMESGDEAATELGLPPSLQIA